MICAVAAVPMMSALPAIALADGAVVHSVVDAADVLDEAHEKAIASRLDRDFPEASVFVYTTSAPHTDTIRSWTMKRMEKDVPSMEGAIAISIDAADGGTAVCGTDVLDRGECDVIASAAGRYAKDGGYARAVDSMVDRISLSAGGSASVMAANHAVSLMSCAALSSALVFSFANGSRRAIRKRIEDAAEPVPAPSHLGHEIGKMEPIGIDRDDLS